MCFVWLTPFLKIIICDLQMLGELRFRHLDLWLLLEIGKLSNTGPLCLEPNRSRPAGWPHSPQSPPLPTASLTLPECVIPGLMKSV